MPELLVSLLKVLLVILGFGVLIFVHELGHFLAAKWAGIRAEGFAIGMGPPVASWRRGIGFALGSTDRAVRARTGRVASQLSDDELRQHGLGETEYSLRWLPIGGFVKMLGQEDMRPGAVSDDPRSYNRCPVGRRMIVVSAGVIMNLLLAAVLFVVAFLVGVPFLAPVVGEVHPAAPAAKAVATNAAEVGVAEPGLRPGDRVLRIDGDDAETFASLQIATAMGKPDVPIELHVAREGVGAPLRFSIVPEKDEITGLLGIGVAPASSSALVEADEDGIVARLLERSGLAEAGVRPGMTLVAAEGSPITTWQQLHAAVERSGGAPVRTRWVELDDDGREVGDAIEADMRVEPEWSMLPYPPDGTERGQDYEHGLLGLVPLVRIDEVLGDNRDVLRAGDVVLRIADLEGPRMVDFREAIVARKGRSVELSVLRDGAVVDVTAQVDRRGRLGVGIGYAWEQPLAAAPMKQVRRLVDDGLHATAAAGADLPPRLRLEAVNGAPITDWPSFRAALVDATASAAEHGGPARLELAFTHPTPGAPRETVTLEVDATTVDELHDLGWSSSLPSVIFQPIETVRSAGGNPLRAIGMGLEETHKLILLTYLTIDRLFRGTVEVKQLRGPVGIVDLGSDIVDGGLMYLVFFLAMISVNLAVINFLPLPIVDGGLFLFLVYEKLKGRPPSIAFQNAATLVGMFLIVTVLLVVTFHDVVRIIS